MTIAFYMDHNVPRAIALGLRLREIDVLTAYEDDRHRINDSELLDRATELKRVMFSYDDDMLREAVERQKDGRPFAGVVFAHPMQITIGQCVQELELLAKAGNPADFHSTVIFLPI